MEQFQIREMRETDIAQVEAIEQEIFSVPWSEKSFRDEMQNKLAVYFCRKRITVSVSAMQGFGTCRVRVI